MFNKTGTRLLSCGYGGHISVWNTANGTALFSEIISRVAHSAACTADGTRILVAGGNGSANFVDLPATAR